MASIAGIHGETHIENGALFHYGKKGFDFSLYDEEYNLKHLRNIFIGHPGRFSGTEELYGLTKRRTGYEEEDWKALIDSFGGSPGQNIPEEKNSMTVVGELQFGNWALVKHDLLRLLNTSDEFPIDFYIYIAATGSLQRKLSDGIVNFDRAVTAIEENRRIIKTPMWVIGIDEVV